MTELIFLLFGVLIYFLRFKSQIGFEIKTQMLIFYLFTRTTMISFVFIPWLSSCFYLLLLKTFLDKNLARKRDLVHQQSLFVCLFVYIGIWSLRQLQFETRVKNGIGLHRKTQTSPRYLSLFPSNQIQT